MSHTAERPGRTGRRLGYAVAIAVNAAGLIVVNNVLDWGWFSWLTEDFREVLPILNVSLAASIAANLAYLVFDPRRFKALAELVLLSISLAVTIRMLQVFPFDFSAYGFSWDVVARSLLGLAIFGIVVGMISQVAQLARAAGGAAGTGG
jgi:hypothetical protein